MFARATVLVTVIGVLTVVSAQTTKQPWHFSLDERIAMRTDPRLAHERVAFRAGAAGFLPVVDAFDGKTHAELFLPHQVFRTLMNGAYVGMPSRAEAFRRGKVEAVQQEGLPADFWDRLEVVAALHIADAQAVNEMIAALPNLHGPARARTLDELAVRQRYACRSAAEALAAARREFGAERFDRFLYRAIAVQMSHATDELPRAEQLLSIERGCR